MSAFNKEQDIFSQKELGEILSKREDSFPRGQYSLDSDGNGNIKISQIKKYYIYKDDLKI